MNQWSSPQIVKRVFFRCMLLAALIVLFQRQIGVAVVKIDSIVSFVDISEEPQMWIVINNSNTSSNSSNSHSPQWSDAISNIGRSNSSRAFIGTIRTNIPAKAKFDPDTTFHIPAYNRILRLVNNDNIISWGYKKASGFTEEFRIKSFFTPDLAIVRLHELSTTEKQAVWRNISHDSFLWESQICDAIELFRQTGQVKPHVLFTKCNENVGEFSRYVPEHKTTSRNDQVEWSSHGCASDEEVWEYLNHSHTLAVFTTQHHFIDHPKVHSLPIGIKYTMKGQVLKLLRAPRANKTKLLMINDNGWKHRKQVTASVVENFARSNISLINTYNNRKSSHYLKELRRSKFILAPSGLGWDCYRIWEALHFNTIPIIERYHRPRDGWRRTLDGLPVLWVEDFSEVTPTLLRTEYQKIAAKGAEYQYEKLTRQWWIQFIRSQIIKTVETK